MSGSPVPSPIPPARLAYSGTPTVITTGLETVPTDFPLAMLQFTGTYSMGGPTSLAAGQYVGQRVLTMPSNTSSGTIQWVIHGASPEAPILSPIEQSAYGVAYCEVIDWVWDGFRWNLVSVFNPANGPFDAAQLFGDLTNCNIVAPQVALKLGSALYLQNPLIYIDPFSSTNFDPNFYNQIVVELTFGFGNLTLDGTPTIGFPSDTGALIQFINSPGSFHDVTLQSDFFYGGTNLKLKTPIVILKPGDSIWLHKSTLGTPWVEVGRSIRTPSEYLHQIVGTVSLTPRAEVLLPSLLASPETLGSPNILDGYYDRQEMLIQLDPQSPFAPLTLQDVSTNPTSKLRLSTATLDLYEGDSVKLKWLAAPTSRWVEMHRTTLL